MATIFLRFFLAFNLLFCTTTLFCPTPQEIEQALEELSIPEISGTDEHLQVQGAYRSLKQSYQTNIADIVDHIHEVSDAEHLTLLEGVLFNFAQEIEDTRTYLANVYDQFAPSEKDSKNLLILLEDVLDLQQRINKLIDSTKERFTATNVKIAETLAEDEPAPQQTILDDCPKPEPKPSPRTSKKLYHSHAPSHVHQKPLFYTENDNYSDYDSCCDAEEDDVLDDPVVQGVRAQQAITAARPLAQTHEFEVIGKACAYQGMTLDCGYHATCNAHVIAKVIEGMHILQTPVTWQNIPLPTRQDILKRKGTFLSQELEPIAPGSAIPGDTLVRFATFNENLIANPQPQPAPVDEQSADQPALLIDFSVLPPAPLAPPQVFQSTQQQAFYFDSLEYMQNKEREIISDLASLAAFFNASEANKQQVWTFLQGFVIDENDGNIQTLFPDQEITMPNTPFSTETFKNTYLCWRALTTTGTYGPYSNMLTAFNQGKTLVIPWLTHSGTAMGCGHWTCKVFVPEKKNGSASFNFVKIINIDSCDPMGSRHIIDENVKRFVFDLLHVKMPSPAELNTIAAMFNPRNVFAERYAREAALAQDAIPQAIVVQ